MIDFTKVAVVDEGCRENGDSSLAMVSLVVLINAVVESMKSLCGCMAGCVWYNGGMYYFNGCDGGGSGIFRRWRA